MKSDNLSLIILVLKTLNCNQKALAQRLDVSPSQITKWKKGEHLSDEMRARIESLCGLEDRNSDILAIVGTVENYDKWYGFISHMAENALENSETGFEATMLQDDERGTLLLATLISLQSLQLMGSEAPQSLPESLDFNYDDFDLVEERSHDKLYQCIHAAFEALDDLSGFFDAYIHPIVFRDIDDGMDELGYALEERLIKLAFIKSTSQVNNSNQFEYFSRHVMQLMKNDLKEIKLFAMKNRIPLGAELMNMVIKTPGELGAEAEHESMGFNEGRLHPDIYMHELLQGNRVINQVLPLICKKLGITEIDFKDMHLKV